MTKEEIVYALLEKYNQEYYQTPKIDEIKFVRDNNSWGRIKYF